MPSIFRKNYYRMMEQRANAQDAKQPEPEADTPEKEQKKPVKKVAKRKGD